MESGRNINKLLFLILISIISLSSLGLVFSASQEESYSFKYNLKPSQTVNGQLTITNTKNTPFNVSISKKKLLFDSNHLIYSDEGIAQWITVNPTNFILNPGESKSIKFNVSAPSKINYSDAVGALIIMKTPIVTQIQKKESNSNFNIQLATEIVVPIVVGLPGQIVESLQLTEHKAPIILLGLLPGDFIYKLKNNGTVYANMTGNMEIKGITGSENVQFDGGVYPEDEIVLTKQWTPGLADLGLYNVKTTINYGRFQQDKIIETNDTILVIPVWLIIILLLTISIWIIRKKDGNIPIKIEFKRK